MGIAACECTLVNKFLNKKMRKTKRFNNIKAVSYFLLTNCLISSIHGHGRLVDPPGRASMWRYGYNTAVDYNDNQLFCGGFDVQHFRNGGKCGVCGDESGKPQLNQPPGPYATGIITRNYLMNTNVTMRFEITASHKGYLEFRICPNNDVTKPATQECLDQYLLKDAKTGGTKFYFNWGTAGVYDAFVSLPRDLTCSQCVVQWRYKTGNSWGCINDDPSKPENCGIGLGRQEEFYACADVAIFPPDGVVPTTTMPSTTSVQQATTVSPVSSSTSKSVSTFSTSTLSTAPSPSSASAECVATGIYTGNANINWWCSINCPGIYCSSTFCSASCNQTVSATSSVEPTSISTSVAPSKSSAMSTKTTSSITTIKTTFQSSTSTTKTTSLSSSASSKATTISLNCPPRNTFANNPSVIAWCTRSCAQGYCPQLLCDCSSIVVQSTTPNNVVPTSSVTISSTDNLSQMLSSLKPKTTETPPTTRLTCIGAGAWRSDTAVAAWCDTNCKLNNCPPNTCQCSRDGTLTELSYGIGDKCETVMQNISTEYKLYMDLWCKHNCPRFGCWNIPDICKC